MRIAEVAGPMMVPFTTSSQTVSPQSLFGMGYYSSLLQQRAMMAPQLTEEEAEMVEMGPYYGMGEVDRETAENISKMYRIAGPIWLIAGFFGDYLGNKAGSALSAVSGTAIAAGSSYLAIKGDNLTGGSRAIQTVIALIAVGFTIHDIMQLFKKKADSPTFKTKLTKLTKSFAPA